MRAWYYFIIVLRANNEIMYSSRGSIQTPLLDKAFVIQGGESVSPTAIPRNGTADEVAQTVLFLLSDASSFTTGAIYTVDGGWHC